MKALTILRAVLLVATLYIFGSWGFLVHKTCHQLAVYELPTEMQHFFYKNMQYITDSAVRPDLRRNRDTTETPRHFIDPEVYGDSAVYRLPETWSAALAKYPKDTLLKYGSGPWHIVMMKDKLVEAFKTGNSDSILFYAVDMAHYIEDINVPLHTTMWYDGQKTNQRGIHALWESVTPEMEITAYNLYSAHQAAYINDPQATVWQAVRHANTLLPDVIAKEQEVSKHIPDSVKYKIVFKYGKNLKYYTDTFAVAYGKALAPTINDQLLRSANMVADFWYTAWVDAGKPNLEKLLPHRFKKKDARRLQKELNSFRNNTLIKDSILNSTRGNFRE